MQLIDFFNKGLSIIIGDEMQWTEHGWYVVAGLRQRYVLSLLEMELVSLPSCIVNRKANANPKGDENNQPATAAALIEYADRSLLKPEQLDHLIAEEEHIIRKE